MCQIPQQFLQFNLNLHSFLYSDYEYFAWFATPEENRTLSMFERMLRWKRLTRSIGDVNVAWANWRNGNHVEHAGLVTRVFLCHLQDPIGRPILDRWVWLAYIRLTGGTDRNGKKIVKTPKNSKRHYESYKKFFNELYAQLDNDFGQPPQIQGVDEEIIKMRILDRALWEFGRIPLPNG